MDSETETFRAFSRFYTRLLGTLNEGLLETKYSLTEARILYEIAATPDLTAATLCERLQLDQGYLSRTLAKLHKSRLIARKAVASDARQASLSLTKSGHEAFVELDERANNQVREILEPLSPPTRTALMKAMTTIEQTLAPKRIQPRIYALRNHRPGDMGWVIQRHGAIYHEEYGWDQTFEALVARIAADFIDQYDPARERCWIAEAIGEPLGCIFLVKHPDQPDVARLRLLLVEPTARGLGLGAALVRQCTQFAREAGYRKITLWTNSVLSSARRIYEHEGYRLVNESLHHSFGKDLIGQTWELDLLK
jgi:DNA-binding MarR family transcriptional regulator/GNAT superfamily N-acetyltransferase